MGRERGAPLASPGRLARLALLGSSLALAGACGACGEPGRPPTASLSVAEAMGGSGAVHGDDAVDAGYARATAPRPFAFPADHGPHPDFRTEWWYFTGNLQSADGRRFGYQLTFFRSALAPPRPTATGEAAPDASGWATRQAYLAHFALSDIDGGRFDSAERLARGALGLAGARAEPFRVSVADWSATAAPTAAVDGGSFLPLTLSASDGETAIELRLEPGKPMVLHGDRGLSAKGAGGGNASYYYSFTRLPTRGTVTAGGRELEVTGSSWLDREWSTSALAPGQVGWDWFSLQLADGRELMLFRLREEAAPTSAGGPADAGTLVAADGSFRALAPGEATIEVLERWRSRRSGALYPAGWRLRVPSEGIELLVTPRLADQELDVGFVYWEGAVEVATTEGDAAGVGYVELTGYAP